MSRRRLNSKEAAEALGISVDAVRMRARRGTLEAEHDANGRLYIWLDADEPQSDAGALISEMRGRIEDLRGQLEAERQAHAEARRIIAGFVERIPAIDAPSDEREASAGSALDERVVRQADASAANVVGARRYSMDPIAMLMFAAGVGAAVSFANPLLISRMGSPVWWLLLMLWLLPPVFGFWLGRSHALSEADTLAALREERLHVRDGSDEAASLDAQIRYRASHAGDLGITPLHAMFAGLAAVLPGAAVGSLFFGIEVLPSLLVGAAQGFLAGLFVLSGTSIGVGLVLRQGEQAHQNGVGGVSAARSAGTTQALIGFAGTIIAAVIGVIGVLIGALLDRGG